MEKIQFLTYILSISSVLLAGFALWIAFRLEEKLNRNVQVLQNQISMLRDSYTQGNKNGK